MKTATGDVKVHIDVNVLLNTRSYINTACINLFHKLQRHVVDESDGTITCIGLYPAPALPVPHVCLYLFKDKTSPQDDLLSRLDSHLHNPYLSLQIAEKMADQAAQSNVLPKPYLMTVNVVLVQDVLHKIPVSCLPGKETLKKETTCAICLEDLCTTKQLKLLHCSHQFHFRCISKWLQSRNSCPLCSSGPEEKH